MKLFHLLDKIGGKMFQYLKLPVMQRFTKTLIRFKNIEGFLTRCICKTLFEVRFNFDTCYCQLGFPFINA